MRMEQWRNTHQKDEESKFMTQPTSRELWRTISEFPLYVVSNRGRFASKTGKEKRVLSRKGTKGSPQQVRLYQMIDGERKEFKKSAGKIMRDTWPEYPNPYETKKKAPRSSAWT